MVQKAADGLEEDERGRTKKSRVMAFYYVEDRFNSTARRSGTIRSVATIAHIQLDLKSQSDCESKCNGDWSHGDGTKETPTKAARSESPPDASIDVEDHFAPSASTSDNVKKRRQRQEVDPANILKPSSVRSRIPSERRRAGQEASERPLKKAKA
ncbi:hypothetical protein B0H19DRAFT_1083435 [Mycena capillaripes]|nr:hypothetical protein B0H19DRAFT_1083435 [Mycena capillaripes]